jgi:lambda repressor-like predicted transcriptional regulator
MRHGDDFARLREILARYGELIQEKSKEAKDECQRIRQEVRRLRSPQVVPLLSKHGLDPRLGSIYLGIVDEKRDVTHKKGVRGAGWANERQAVVVPMLEKKGWSIHEWASQANVDFHTVHSYLNGKTNPHPNTRKKLADSLDISVLKLPK